MTRARLGCHNSHIRRMGFSFAHTTRSLSNGIVEAWMPGAEVGWRSHYIRVLMTSRRGNERRRSIRTRIWKSRKRSPRSSSQSHSVASGNHDVQMSSAQESHGRAACKARQSVSRMVCRSTAQARECSGRDCHSLDPSGDSPAGFRVPGDRVGNTIAWLTYTREMRRGLRPSQHGAAETQEILGRELRLQISSPACDKRPEDQPAGVLGLCVA